MNKDSAILEAAKAASKPKFGTLISLMSSIEQSFKGTTSWPAKP